MTGPITFEVASIPGAAEAAPHDDADENDDDYRETRSL
jgi:hypothetical protein